MAEEKEIFEEEENERHQRRMEFERKKNPGLLHRSESPRYRTASTRGLEYIQRNYTTNAMDGHIDVPEWLYKHNGTFILRREGKEYIYKNVWL